MLSSSNEESHVQEMSIGEVVAAMMGGEKPATGTAQPCSASLKAEQLC